MPAITIMPLSLPSAPSSVMCASEVMRILLRIFFSVNFSCNIFFMRNWFALFPAPAVPITIFEICFISHCAFVQDSAIRRKHSFAAFANPLTLGFVAVPLMVVRIFPLRSESIAVDFVPPPSMPMSRVCVGFILIKLREKLRKKIIFSYGFGKRREKKQGNIVSLM